MFRVFSKIFFKIVVLKNFAIFTGKYLCWSLFIIKLQAWSPVTLLKRVQQMRFPVNIAKFLRTSFLQNTSWRLLLNVTFVKIKANSQFKILCSCFIPSIYSIFYSLEIWYKRRVTYSLSQNIHIIAQMFTDVTSFYCKIPVFNRNEQFPNDKRLT